MSAKHSNWLQGITQEQNDVLTQCNEFYQALNNLQYEGRISRTRNMQEIKKAIDMFHQRINPYIRIKETVLFPYLSTHVPKLEPILRFLSAEHVEIKSRFKSFERLFRKVCQNDDPADQQNNFAQLRAEGVYLFCLLRNHFQVQNSGIYLMIDQQLTQTEQLSLNRKYARLKTSVLKYV